ncbi:unnamed protein product [marine sediment metagenome]|uniref:Uncharacterized protein n=1 Tax=marine sediment metagenome TaxID=412755 RepID=X0ZJ19_9ZZZZ
MYYEYYRKEIKYKQKIIDTTLTFVKKNGLWGTIIGGACEDYDGIEILLRLARETEYRKDDIKRLVQKTKKTILRNELEGSFPYRFFKESIKLRWFTPKSKLEKIVYAYSGLNFISTPLYFPDIWATYFRILTIKRIDIYLQGINNISMYTLPAWGYF